MSEYILKITGGEDIIIFALKLILEFGILYAISLLGLLARDQIFSDKTNLRRNNGYAILVSGLMVLMKNSILSKTGGDNRTIFTITLFLGFTFPIFKSALRNGDFFFLLLRYFRKSIGLFLESFKEVVDKNINEPEDRVKKSDDDESA